MKVFLCIVLSLFCLTGIGQNEVAKMTSLKGSIKDSFTITNEASNTFITILKDADFYHAYLHDQGYTILKTAKVPVLSRGKDEVVGYFQEKDQLKILMTNSKNGLFGVLAFNFSDRSSRSSDIDFQLTGNRLLIDGITYNDAIYLFTITKREDAIGVTVFNEVFEAETRTIAFKEDTFLDRRERPLAVYELLTKTNSGSDFIEKERINNSVPNSLEKTSKAIKVYQNDDVLTITSDTYDEYTYVIQIALETMETNIVKVPQVAFTGSRLGIKSNSFYLGGNLFQMAGNKKKLTLQMTDLSENKLVNSYTVHKNEPLTFRNTAVFKASKSEKTYADKNETNALLKNIAADRAGLTVYKRDGTFEVTFGSFEEKEPETAILVGAFLGGFGGVILAASINSLSSSFVNYSSTNAVRTIGLFDSNFKHLSGAIKDNPFDKIQKYIHGLDRVKAPSVFLYNGAYHLGYFNPKDSAYTISKFSL